MFDKHTSHRSYWCFCLFHLNKSDHFILPFLKVDHVDKSGQSSLVHAALRGHQEIIQYLLELEWSAEGQQQDCALKNKALQQAFIAASSMGHTQVRLTSMYFTIPQVNLHQSPLRNRQHIPFKI